MTSPHRDVKRVFVNPRLSWLLAGVAALAVAPQSHAQTDGWGQFNGNGPGGSAVTFTSQSTFGVTLGTNALQTGNPQGAFWGPATGNLIAQGDYNALKNATTLSVDLTLLNSQINGGSGNFDGFAQSNVLAVQLFHNGGAGTTFPGGGFFPFMQHTFSTAQGDADSRNHGAQWSGDDGTRTLTWNLANFTAQDPSSGNSTKTLSQLLTDHPDMQGAAIYFVQQAGNGSATVGPSQFFWDNVRLLDGGNNTLAIIGNFEPVPEPSSFALAALVVPPVVVAVRRRRAARQAKSDPPAAA
ncbi:MAG TPA: hypothetical protein VGF55_34030 [Gemmataceae bacterium]|jgi:hypothetical protein